MRNNIVIFVQLFGRTSVPWRLLLFVEDLNDQSNNTDDNETVLEQVTVSHHGHHPLGKTSGGLEVFTPARGQTVSSGQTLLKTQNEYSINRHDPQQKEAPHP